MSVFELKYDQLGGVRSQIRGVGSELAGDSLRLRRQMAMLYRQQGFGIEDVRNNIQLLSKATSTLSQDSYKTANFIDELNKSVVTYENKAAAAMSDSKGDEKIADIIKLMESIISKFGMLPPIWVGMLNPLKLGTGAAAVSAAVAAWLEAWMKQQASPKSPGTSKTPAPAPSTGGSGGGGGSTQEPGAGAESGSGPTGEIKGPGDVRYISQIPSSSAYNASYWGEYDPTEGCAVSCVSMAMSSMGIDMLPKDVCANNLKSGSNPVYMYWGNSGKCTNNKEGGTGSLDSALEEYSSNPSNYSAPIIKLPDRQHYVLVTGKNADGTYTIMDPANQSNTVWNGSSTPQVVQYHR